MELPRAMNVKNRWYPLLLMGALVVGLLAALYAGTLRYRAESASRTVEVGMPYTDIEALAQLSGKDTVEVMRLLKESGLTTVFIKEFTLEDLESSGEFTTMSGEELLLLSFLGNWPLTQLSDVLAREKNSPEGTYFLLNNKESFESLSSQLRAKTKVLKTYSLPGDIYVIHIAAKSAAIKDLGFGFPEEPFDKAEKAGLFSAVQIRNWPGVSGEDIVQVFRPLRNVNNLSLVAFSDAVVPGYPENKMSLVAELKELDVPIAQIEFYPQDGVTGLGKMLNKRVVRLHSISDNEMPQYKPREAFSRYLLAATERNARFLLLRPFINPSNENVLEDNLDFISKIDKGLMEQGLKVGRASLFAPLNVPPWLIFLMGLAVITGGVLILQRVGLTAYSQAFGLAAALLWLIILLVDPSFGRKLMAFSSAVVFPIYALMISIRIRRCSMTESIAALLRASAVSLLGAVLIVGLLADTSYMLKLDQFSGVKLSNLLPLVFVAGIFYFFSGGSMGAPFKKRFIKLLQEPVLVKHAAIGTAILVVLALFIVRSGNEGVIATTSLELKFRMLLDNILGVRPRTKEFLIGHPLLMMLFYAGYSRDNRLLPLLLLGTIGQVSMINTFTHIHTPLIVSLLRSFHGLWTGILLGLLLIVVYDFIAQRVKKYFEFEEV